ncbi:MAG: hypothetical protein E6G53_06900 [Actinobacteria bacterium]|nr:MAG: hypothetical protein E6G53_06900 [Actinomycetota bacterium]
MTRAEAALRCEELNGERVRPRIPGLPPREPLKATTEAKPKPPQPDDPRTSVFRNVPPYGAG